jgi:hypothetical protein
MHLIGELIGKISISTPNIYLAKGEGLLMNTDNIFDKTDRCKRTTPTILGGLTFEQKMYSGDSIDTDGLMQCNILRTKETNMNKTNGLTGGALAGGIKAYAERRSLMFEASLPR